MNFFLFFLEIKNEINHPHTQWMKSKTKERKNEMKFILETKLKNRKLKNKTENDNQLIFFSMI